MAYFSRSVKRILKSLGYKIKPIEHENDYWNYYEIILKSFLAIKRQIKIVIVGSNDGRIKDPAYDFIKENPNSTQVFLVEPQSLLNPMIKQNFSFHPNYHIFNFAIGEEGEMTLYTIKEEFWESTQPQYGQSWPSYRAPTGVASFNKENVVDWIKKHGFLKQKDPNDIIQENTVKTSNLLDILKDFSMGIERIDVLQIDAEGEDDNVIYNSSIPTILPKVIYFEAMHIPKGRFEKLVSFLKDHNYSPLEYFPNSIFLYGGIQ